MSVATRHGSPNSGLFAAAIAAQAIGSPGPRGASPRRWRASTQAVTIGNRYRSGSSWYWEALVSRSSPTTASGTRLSASTGT